jgi:hypothetical protein
LVIKRSSAAETERLVADLLGGEPLRRETALARLAILGARAVDRLVAALGSAISDDQRVAVLAALERIGDARAVPAASPLLRSASPDVALAAVSALRPHLNAADLAVAAATLDALAGLLLDATRPPALRRAVLAALDDLPPEVIAPLAARLDCDPALALPLPAVPDGSPAPAEGAHEWSLERLETDGLPESADAVRSALAAAPAAPLPLLHRLVVLIRQHEAHAGEARRAEWLAARAAVHQALAARGSRVALYDLRETLEGTAPLPPAMIGALKAIGDTSCLEPLASALAATDEPWLQAHLTDAFTAIRQRERLTRRHAVIRRLAERYPQLV